MTVLIVIGLFVYISMFVVGAWILTRMNLQLKRLQDSPTPKESLHVLSDLLEAQDLQITACIRKAGRNEGAIDDLLVRVKSIQARTNQEARKNDQVDVTALADYIQQQQQATEPGQQPPASNFDQKAGEDIDYR